ncbi:MAG: biotin transporter BioY [Candidatus Thermoplasmatota archaeon]|jgi:biotin transport system substrate-specific component|nr:biotin transporter BioY [Candidatus Thermoplasmatota archaeon]
MEINMYIDKYKTIRYNFFRWRYELNVFYKLTLALSFACLTGLLAQLRFYLPGTPVPVTGQVFGVLLAGVILGTWGGMSQIMYLGIGAAGIPWFAGFNSGLSYLLGPTGGYLIGFVFSAFFIGYIVDRYIRSRSFLTMFAIMLFSTFTLIYIPGLIQLYIWMGAAVGIRELITIAVIPFIAADIIKAAVAAGIASSITPKNAYGKEIDV